MPKLIDAPLRAEGLRAAICASRFNEFLVNQLVDGAVSGLTRTGADPDAITVFRVPGAFELPVVVHRAALSGRFDLVVALGVVIRGATPHFDLVAGQAAAGLARAAFEASPQGVAVTFGVLTTDTIEQAIERAGTKAGNKGFDAALAAIELHHVLRAAGAST